MVKKLGKAFMVIFGVIGILTFVTALERQNAYNKLEEKIRVNAKVEECYIRLENRGTEFYYCRYTPETVESEVNINYTRGAWIATQKLIGQTVNIGIDNPARRELSNKVFGTWIAMFFCLILFLIGTIMFDSKEEE